MAPEWLGFFRFIIDSDPALSDSCCWRLDALFDPVWRECEGEFLAYDRASGDTHYFDPITATLLIRIQQGGVVSSELINYVADRLAYEPDDALVSHIGELLQELELKKFVTPCCA